MLRKAGARSADDDELSVGSSLAKLTSVVNLAGSVSIASVESKALVEEARRKKISTVHPRIRPRSSGSVSTLSRWDLQLDRAMWTQNTYLKPASVVIHKPPSGLGCVQYIPFTHRNDDVSDLTKRCNHDRFGIPENYMTRWRDENQGEQQLSAVNFVGEEANGTCMDSVDTILSSSSEQNASAMSKPSQLLHSPLRIKSLLVSKKIHQPYRSLNPNPMSTCNTSPTLEIRSQGEAMVSSEEKSQARSQRATDIAERRAALLFNSTHQPQII